MLNFDLEDIKSLSFLFKVIPASALKAADKTAGECLETGIDGCIIKI